MESLPFIGRQSKLSVLKQGVTRDTGEVLYPVIGPTGIGKSTLLNRFADDCRDRDVPVVHYSIREPASLEQFLTRLIEQWQETYPNISSRGVTGVIPALIGNTGRALANVPGMGLAGRGAGVVLQTAEELISGQDESIDPVTEIEGLAQQTCEHYDSEQVVLIIDQFDESKIKEDTYKDISRFIRDLNSCNSSSEIVCCVGAQERFYNPSQETIREIELEPFDTNTVEVSLAKTGFDTDKAEDVREASSGSPYFIEQILQIADDRGTISAALDDLSPVEEKRYEMLERRFLETLSAEKQQLLREICALPELRPETVSYVTDQSLSKIENELRELQQQTVVSRIGYDHGQPVYRLHELQLDYLRERISRQERIDQHRRIAAYYAERATEAKLESTSELFTENGEQRLRKFITAGTLFEYHLQKLPKGTSVDVHVEEVLDELKNVQPDQAREALYVYFRQHQPLSLDVEALGISRQIATDEITGALDPTSSKTSSLEIAQLYQRIQEEERLTDGESELVVLLIDTLRRTKGSTKADSKVESEDVSLLEHRISVIEEKNYSDTTELRSVVSIAFRFWYSILTRDTDGDSEICVWKFIESEYGLTKEDWKPLREVALATISVLLDTDRLEQLGKQYGENGIHPNEEVGESESIRQYGLQGGLSRSVSSPILDGLQLIGDPNPEEIQELTEKWAELEEEYAEDGHGTLATLCRDIRQLLLEPLTGEEVGLQVGARLITTFNRDNVEVMSMEPIKSIRHAGAAIRNLTNPE